MNEKIELSLPEVPEGFFWRVGEVPIHTGPNLTEEMVPAVLLMERVYSQEKPNKATFNLVVEGEPGNWVVERESSKFSTAFYAPKKSDIPEFAVGSVYRDYSKAFDYYVEMNAEGIQHIAESVLNRYNEGQEETRKYEEEKRKEKEAKDRFYGDYPPKALGKV